MAPAEAPQQGDNEIVHVFWDDRMLAHDTGMGVFDTLFDPGFLEVLEPHPENADRVRNMVSILKRGPIHRFVSWRIGEILRDLANVHSKGRMLIVQEGGYHVTYSAYCVHATLEGVLHLPVPLLPDPIACYPEDEALPVKVIDSIKEYWKKNVAFLQEEDKPM